MYRRRSLKDTNALGRKDRCELFSPYPRGLDSVMLFSGRRPKKSDLTSFSLSVYQEFPVTGFLDIH